MAKLEIKYEVHFRNEFGRFRAVLDEAGTRSVIEGADQLAKDARALAPSGPGRKDYARRPKLRDSIRVLELSSRSAAVGSSAGHAAANESGAPAHPITTTWPHGEETVIQHPAMSGKHFLKSAIDAFVPEWLAIMQRNYPG